MEQGIRRGFGIVLLWGCAAAGIASAQATRTSRRAIVIGVNKTPYANEDLVYAEVAATKVGEALRSRGFSVTSLLGAKATRRNVANALQDWMGSASSSSDELVFYYAGHGDGVSDPRDPQGAVDGAASFLYLMDCNPDSVLGTCWMMDNFGVISRSSNARVIYFVFDACYTGGVGLVKMGQAPAVTDKQARAERGRHAFLAGSPGEVAFFDTKDLKTGVFTHYFLESLGTKDTNKSGMARIQEWFPWVAKNTQAYSKRWGENQLPHRVAFLAGGSGEIDFGLKPKSLVSAGPARSVRSFVGTEEIDASVDIVADRIEFAKGSLLRVRKGATVRLVAKEIVVNASATIDGTGEPGALGDPGPALDVPEWTSQGSDDYWSAVNDCSSDVTHPARGRPGGNGAKGGSGATIVLYVRPTGGVLDIKVGGGPGGAGGPGGPGQLLKHGPQFYCDGCMRHCPGGPLGSAGPPGNSGAITYLDAPPRKP